MDRLVLQQLFAPDGTTVRPAFSAGGYLRAHDLGMEQQYRQQRMQQHQRYLHGQGIRCGLAIVPAGDPVRPWAVRVCPGYALDCCGTEIIVPEPTVVDIRDHVWKQSLDQPSARAAITLRYVAVPIGHVRADAASCGCAIEPHYQPMRLRDSFQVTVQWAPFVEESGGFDPCTQGVRPCPACLAGPGLMLAQVSVPASEGQPITNEHIML